MHVCISTDLYTKIFKRRNALRSRVKYKQISFGAAIYHLHRETTKVLFWIVSRLDKAHNNNVSSLIRPPFCTRLIYRYLYYVLTMIVRGHNVWGRGDRRLPENSISPVRSRRAHTKDCTDCYPVRRHANAGVTPHLPNWPRSSV